MKKMDPSVKVLQYFQDMPLDLAKQALAMAKFTVGQREEMVAASAPAAKVAKKRRGRKPKAAKAPAAAPADAPPVSLRPVGRTRKPVVDEEVSGDE